jgi:hypothetical protein
MLVKTNHALAKHELVIKGLPTVLLMEYQENKEYLLKLLGDK